MTAAQGAQVSEAQIAVHWREEEYYQPPAKFVAQANARRPGHLRAVQRGALPGVLQGIRRPADVGTLLAHDARHQQSAVLEVVCRRPAQRLLQLRGPALGRQSATRRPFIWVPEPEDEAHAGDHLPGAVSPGERVRGAAARILRRSRPATASPSTCRWCPSCRSRCWPAPGWASSTRRSSAGSAAQRAATASLTRGAASWSRWTATTATASCIDHKAKADEAVEAARRARASEVDKVLVWRRHPGAVRVGRARWSRAATSSSTTCSATTAASIVEPVSMPAEAPLFLMYTSGTTGRPKGCQHSTGGYLAYVAGTSKYYQDIHPDDIYWCMADIGWITGHSYIVYGPLALGTTSVMYEGVPDLSGRRPALADRRAARREHLPHRADDDPHAAQGRPGRAGRSTTTTSST